MEVEHADKLVVDKYDELVALMEAREIVEGN